MIAYTIRDETGEPVAIHERHDREDGSKSFAWKQPDGSMGLGGIPMRELPLYRSEGIGNARTVIVSEGEKACDAGWAEQAAQPGKPTFAFVGTVTGSASDPGPAALEVLRDKRVILWPDNDDVGRAHMERIAHNLEGIAGSTYIVPAFEDKPKGYDLYDCVSDYGWGGVHMLAREAIETGAFLSDRTPPPSVRKNPSLFRTARELVATTPPEVRWVACRWVAAGSSTELAGKLKASGKTTWALALCRAVITGEPFLGLPTMRGPVVYLTEQADSSFSVAIERAGLSEAESFRFLSYFEVRGRPWPDVMDEAVGYARDIEAVLIVVDTLGQFAGLRGESENDAGAALAAMEPVQAATGAGIGVLLLRHERKGGGVVGESARGSSAFAGAVDIVLRLARPEGNHRPEVRRIDALSRFDETPDELLIELAEDGRYRALGSSADVELQEARDAILELAPEGMTETEVQDALSLSRTTARRAISELLAEGRLERQGAGKRGDPYRLFFLTDLVNEFGQKPNHHGHGAVHGLSVPLAGTFLSDRTSALAGSEINNLTQAAMASFAELLPAGTA